MKKNKFVYEWVIQGNYGHGWEDLCIYPKNEYDYSSVEHDYREYCIAERFPKRIIERRELAEEV